jgi:hypothetical protein
MRPAGRTDAGRGGRTTRRPGRIGGVWLAAAASLTMTMSAAGAQTICSVFDDRLCTSTFCSVFNDGPCTPDIPYPFGQDLRLTIQTRPPEAPRPSQPDRSLTTLQELYAAMGACWEPPPLDQSRPGTEITIRFSLTRSGEILGEPRFTYSTPSLPAEVKSAYQRAIAAALKRCTPFTLSKGLGGAIAGRPISTRFIDDRGLRRTENAR